MTSTVFIPDAWRTAQEPDAIAEALARGEQITSLLTRATTLVERASQSVEAIIENATLRCQPILAQLAGETDRLELVLARLRAAKRAVK